MTRRNLLSGVAASALAGAAAQAAESQAASVYLELKYYQLHNSPENQSARLTEFLRDGYAPAVAKAGGKLIGAFGNHIGMEAPYVIALTQYDSLGAFQTTIEKLKNDSDYQHALSALTSHHGYPYQREEASLLRTFDGMPQPLLSNESEHHSPRVFELRRYESPTEVTLARKLKMFNGGEIAIFQKLGMRPVFFGETIVGPRMPNLVYMLSFDDLTAREDLWRKFGSDPDWKKLSAPPDVHDSEIVSNISNAILQPLKFSLIR
jgi:hypothetical protein